MIKKIRNNFAFFDYDLSHLTDEEIERAIETIKTIHNSVLTIDEVNKAVIEFSKVINDGKNISI